MRQRRSQGIVVAGGVSAVIAENTIQGVSGDALVIAEDARVDAQNNTIAAATPASEHAD